MANALFVDALKGYEYFLLRRGDIGLEEINQHLIDEGRNPIAQRTFNHYHKLLRNGFRSYIPINKFDVFQSLGNIQFAADRRRYSRKAVDIPTEFSRDAKNWHTARIIDKSIVGFGIGTEKKFPTSIGVSGWVKIEGYYDIPVVIVWRKHSENTTRLGLRSIEFISRYRFVPEIFEARKTKSLRIQRDVPGYLEWENLFAVLWRVNELIDSTSDLVYALEDVYDVEVDLFTPEINYIRFGSPGDTSIKIDFGVAEIIRIVLEKIQFWGLQKRLLISQVEGQEISNESVKLANAITRIEIIRNAVKLSKEIDDPTLQKELEKEIRVAVPSIFKSEDSIEGILVEGSPELAILKERVIPAATDLIAGDDTDYSIEISEIETDDNQ